MLNKVKVLLICVALIVVSAGLYWYNCGNTVKPNYTEDEFKIGSLGYNYKLLRDVVNNYAADYGSRLNNQPNQFVIDQSDLLTNETALVLIDVWGNYPNGHWQKYAKIITQNKIVPLISFCRSKGILIMHATYGSNYKQGAPIALGDYLLSSNEQFFEVMERNNIKNLVYAGYSTNSCVTSRPIGVMNTFNDYNNYVVSDATLGTRSFLKEGLPYTDPRTWPESSIEEYKKITNDALERMIKNNWAKHVTFDDFKRSFVK